MDNKQVSNRERLLDVDGEPHQHNVNLEDLEDNNSHIQKAQQAAKLVKDRLTRYQFCLALLILILIFISIWLIYDLVNNHSSSNNSSNSPAPSPKPTPINVLCKNEFLSTWDTRLISADSSYSNQISLPLQITGVYNFKVYWGDGFADIITAYDQQEVTHSYKWPGVYNIAIQGQIIGFNFNNQGDKLKLLAINQFGCLSLGDNTNGGYFYGCSNLVIPAVDVLDLTKTISLLSAFQDCSNLTTIPSINQWDTSAINNMGYMFAGAINFNDNIGNWNMSKVINMGYMFQNAFKFDQDISKWILRQLLGAMQMFEGTALPTPNYDRLLIGWSSRAVNPMIILGAGNSKYTANSAASQARTVMMNFRGWVISDGGST